MYLKNKFGKQFIVMKNMILLEAKPKSANGKHSNSLQNLLVLGTTNIAKHKSFSKR